MYFKKFLALFACALMVFSSIDASCFNGNPNFAQATTKNWMSYLPNSALVTSVSIPGTHDSGTSRVTACTEGYAKCQSKSISDQLNSGIRYLDLRINDKGLINHGGVACWKSFFKKLYIEDVESYITSFLKKNPKETVILQIKSEDCKKGKDCANIVNKTLAKNNLYYKGKKNIEQLTMGDVRGKFIIFSRQSGINNAYNYTSWDDNVSFDKLWIDSKEGYLQDKYKDTISNKKNTINKFYTKVWQDNDSIKKPVINFTSFTQLPITLNFLYPSVNDYMSSFIDRNNNKKFGFVLMDNPGNSLIQKIYKTNYNRNF